MIAMLPHEKRAARRECLKRCRDEERRHRELLRALMVQAMFTAPKAPYIDGKPVTDYREKLRFVEIVISDLVICGEVP